MRPPWLKLLPFLAAALACSTVTRALPAPATLTAPPPATARPAATLTPAPATAEPARTPTADSERLLVQPGEIYAGDQVSLAVVSDPAWQGAQVKLFLGGPAGRPITSGVFGTFGMNDRPQATFWWAWDTAGLSGSQTLTAVIEPAAGGAPLATLTRTVWVRPTGERPAPEAQSSWAEAESACCVFHYLTHTAAERDLAQIEAAADQAFILIERTLGVQRRGRVTFTLMSRLLGQGGFATDEVYLTYLDRNPAGLDLPTVFTHEGTHILDHQLAQARPTILTEGLAVYVAGGHYHPEDLDRRAAALVALGRYRPLAEVARDFYNTQHETGYLEGGAFIKYLVDQYGWEQFKAMYADFQPNSNEARMLDLGLQKHYGRSLADLEQAWLTYLRSQPAGPDEQTHLRLTIALYDMLRRYQQLDDPHAYFLTAWLPDGATARRRGIITDFIRSPRAPENIALEAMLAAAERALTRRDLAGAEQLITAVDHVLDTRNLFFDPLAARYLRAVNELAARGYEAQTIDLAGAVPQAQAIRTWPILEDIPLYNTGQ